MYIAARLLISTPRKRDESRRPGKYPQAGQSNERRRAEKRRRRKESHRKSLDFRLFSLSFLFVLGNSISRGTDHFSPKHKPSIPCSLYKLPPSTGYPTLPLFFSFA